MCRIPAADTRGRPADLCNLTNRKERGCPLSYLSISQKGICEIRLTICRLRARCWIIALAVKPTTAQTIPIATRRISSPMVYTSLFPMGGSQRRPRRNSMISTSFGSIASPSVQPLRTFALSSIRMASPSPYSRRTSRTLSALVAPY